MSTQGVLTTITNGPALLLVFDDGDPSAYDEGFAYMKEHGIKGTAYAIGNSVAGKYYMFNTLYNAGWDIANHTQTHANLTTLTQAQVQAELTNCQATLEGFGFTRASKQVAYPGGSYNATVLAAMAATNMLTGRSTLLGTDHYIPIADVYELSCDVVFGNTTTLQDAYDWVDDVITKGKIGIGLFHKLVASPSTLIEWGISDFQDLIDYIVSQNIPVLTISELYTLNDTGSVDVRLPY